MSKCIYCNYPGILSYEIIRYDKTNSPVEKLWTCNEHKPEGKFHESLEDLLRAKYKKTSSNPDILYQSIHTYKIYYEIYKDQYDNIELPPSVIFDNLSPVSSPVPSPKPSRKCIML